MTKQKGCNAAANSLGMTFVETGNWDESPKGCLTSEWDGRQVFLNKHPTGSEHRDQAPICLQTGKLKRYKCLFAIEL